MAQMQHYVPQFLLRAFGTGKRDRLHVFDKRLGKSFQASARKIAMEGGFYDFEFMGVPVTLESSLSELESKAARLLKPVARNASLASLSIDDLAILSSFLAAQMTRTRAAREMQLELSGSLAGALRQHAGDDPERLRAVNDYIGDPPELNSVVQEHVGLITHASEHFAPLFMDKAWWLGKTTSRYPLMIGDHPLVLQNLIHNKLNPSSARGALGLSVPGIEIYLPLSPTLVLALYGPVILEMMKREMAAKSVKGNGHAAEQLEQLESGKALNLLPENVENMNSLQIAFSERFVFSSSNDFRLATEMIVESPDIVAGPRFTSN